MPSTNKTAFLGLNQWLGTDKPKREDFNNDNLNVENSVKSHIHNQEAHVSADDRKQWSDCTPVIGQYMGDNAASRFISLGFAPRIVLLFSADRGLVDYNASGSTTNLYSAIYTADGATLGIEASSAGFTVTNSSNSMAGIPTIRLNQSTKAYIYIAYR